MPVFIEHDALGFDRLVVNGGRRGLQVAVATDDLLRVLNATAADIC